jgi:hypothetical protein
VPLRIVVAEPAEQPALAELLGDVNPITQLPWQYATLRLWVELADFPSTKDLLPAQWSLLSRAMMLDDAFVAGMSTQATEARLQIAKFGVASDDLARLRIVIAQAEEADAGRPASRQSSRTRRGPLKGLPEASGE